MGIFCILVVYLCIYLDVLRAVFSLILGGLCVGCAMLPGFSGSLHRRNNENGRCPPGQQTMSVRAPDDVL